MPARPGRRSGGARPRWAGPGGVSDRADVLAVGALAVTMLVVVGLLVQAVRSTRAQQDTVDAALEDFAGFAADRLTAELDQRFSALFLDLLSAARTTHYLKVARPDAPVAAPVGEVPLPEGVSPWCFTFEPAPAGASGRVEALGRTVEPEALERVGDVLRAHLPVYPPPAPYLLIRGDGPEAVLFRREQAYEREAVYGCVVRFDAFTDWYRRLTRQASLLPRSLVREADGGSGALMSVSYHLAPDAPPLYEEVGPVMTDSAQAWSFAARAGRIAVSARIDVDRAGPLLARTGGPSVLPLLSAAALAALVVLGLAIRVVHRRIALARMRERFVANVSHDLRTPITQVRMFGESLLRDRIADPDERRRGLEIVVRQAEILGDMVDNLLRAAAGPALPLARRPTVLEAVVADAVDALEPLATDRRVEVSARCSGDGEATIDPAVLRRVVTNLLDNALRHGAPGRDAASGMDATSGGGRVEVVVHADADAVTITVDDDGPGIPPAARTRAFERFERIGSPPRGRSHPGTEDRETGVGLGLAVVRDLAERHGGWARIGASPLGGTRVEVRLEAP